MTTKKKIIKIKNKIINFIKSCYKSIRQANTTALPFALGVLLILIPVVYLTYKNVSQVDAIWFSEQWFYRKEIQVSYTGTTELNNFQIKLANVETNNLYTAGKLNTNCSDIRFTDIQGNLLNYWIEDQNNTADTIDCTSSAHNIWVKVPTIQPGGAKIHMYYGNPAATAQSNGAQVFEFFDNFGGSNIDATKWTTSGSPLVSNGNLTLQDTAAANPEGIVSKTTFCSSSPANNESCVLEVRASQSDTSLNEARLGFSNRSIWQAGDFNSGVTTFTAGATKRNGSDAGPFAAGVLVQGDPTNSSSTDDIVSFAQGSQLSGNFYQNFDTTQGSVVLWWTPEYSSSQLNGADLHYIWYINANYYLAYDYSQNRYEMKIGTQTMTTPATLTAGTKQKLTARWDTQNIISGSNYASLTIDATTVFGITTQPTVSEPAASIYVGSNGTGGGSSALFGGLAVYRRVLYESTTPSGINVGNGNEVGGGAADMALTTGSWDVVFALPTNASTGALATGTGNAWSQPHASNLLYTDATNTGGFMMNGTYTNDGWADEGTPTTVAALATGEKVFFGGYKVTSDAADEGVYYDKTVTAGNDWVIRALAHSDGTSIPKIILYDQTNGAEIGSLTGTNTSTRTNPDVFILTGKAPADMTTLRVKLVNTQASGTSYWHQVEVYSNIIANPSMETGAGDPWIPTGYTQVNMSAGDSAQELTTTHSGSSGVSGAPTWTGNEHIRKSFTISNGVFYTMGGFTYKTSGTPSIGSNNAFLCLQANTTCSRKVNTTTNSVWEHTKVIFRATTTTGAVGLEISNNGGVAFYDDFYAHALTAVSLTITPANLANATESTGIRVGGTSTLTQPTTGLTTTQGLTKFKYTPRHSAADVAKFGITTPYIATYWADSNNYIKVYWSAANTIALAYSINGTTATGTWDATGAITAGTTYDFDIYYVGGSSMILKINGTDRITLSNIPSAFTTAPTTTRWGTNYNGTTDSSQADATFAAPSAYKIYNHDDSASFVFDSTTGGNHETESSNAGVIQSSTAAVAENTSFNNHTVTLGASNTVLSVNGTSVTHSTQVPNSPSYIKIETTDATNSLSIDHVFVRKLATTQPTVPAFDSFGLEQKSPGPIAYYNFNEGYGDTAHNSIHLTPNGTLTPGASGDNTTTATMWANNPATHNTGKSILLDGTDDYVNVGALGNVNSVSFWIKPATTTQSFIDLNGSAYISSSTGTLSATGFSSPTIYVNGKQSTTIVANQWQHIMVTSATPVNASNILIGRIASSYMKGHIDEVKFFNYVTSATKAKQEATGGASVTVGSMQTDELPNAVLTYNFNENTGSTINDTSGNGNNSTTYQAGDITTANWTGLGKYGNAINFNGTNQYATAPATNSLKITSGMAISAWVKPNNINSNYQTIAGRWQVGVDQHYLLQLDNDNKFTFWFDPDGGDATNQQSVKAINAAENDQWYHVVGIFEPNSTRIRLYVNGALQNATTSASLTSGTAGTVAFTIASKKNGDGDYFEYFNGNIDELNIYNYPLTQRQVMMLFSNSRLPEPIAHYKFDEGFGTVVNNSGFGGSTLNGAISGASWSDTGRFGKSLSFDGGDYVSTSADLPTNNAAWSAWVNPATGGTQMVLGQDSASTGNGSGIRLESSNAQCKKQTAGGSIEINSTEMLNTNTWYHILCTYNDTDGMKLYLNGVQQATNANTDNLTLSATDKTHIGAHKTDASYLQGFNGKIDEPKVFNYDLTAAEVREEYNRAASMVLGRDVQALRNADGGVSDAPPVAHWRFDEGSGNTVYDVTANSNDGTWAGTGSRWSNVGMFGGAGLFNGSDDYVSASANSSINFGENTPFTVSAWVKPSTIGANQWVINKQQNVSNEFLFTLNISSSNLAGFVVGKQNVAATTATSTTTMNSGTWYYLTGVYDGTDAKIYVNGVLENTKTRGFSSATSSASALYLGQLYNNTNRLNGLIDDVRIYNYVRTPQQILQDMHGDTPGPHPIAKWAFDEGDGQYVNSSHAPKLKINDTTLRGTLGANTSAASDDPTWVTDGSCVSGSCLSFDGSNDYVKNTRTLTSTSYSISAWINPTRYGFNNQGNGVFYQGTGASDNGTRLLIGTCTSCTVTQGNTQTLLFENQQEGTSYLSAPNNSIELNTWQHVLLTKEGVNENMYINGKLVASRTSGNTTIPSNNSSFIGFWNSLTQDDRFFQGKIDETQIFNHALAADEVKVIYNQSAVKFK